MFSKVALITCLFAVARAGGHQSGLGIGATFRNAANLGSYGAALGANLDYAGHGALGYGSNHGYSGYGAGLGYGGNGAGLGLGAANGYSAGLGHIGTGYGSGLGYNSYTGSPVSSYQYSIDHTPTGNAYGVHGASAGYAGYGGYGNGFGRGPYGSGAYGLNVYGNRAYGSNIAG